MRQSKYFLKTSKTKPAEDTSANAILLEQGGFVYKEMAGVYAYLPLGFRVIEKIKNIIREEMNAIGGQELIMTSLQRKEVWEKTNRWDDNKVDVWFKSKLKNGADVGLAWSHEEPITTMMLNYISSYRDLPAYVYQFQTKLRNELRAKSGILRGREFVMKDLYSYSLSPEAHEEFYQKAISAYLKIFERVGLGESTFLTFASGGAFTQFSHEFQTVLEAGEDVIYLDRKKKIAINKEVLTEEVLKQLNLKREELEEVKASETGNIFNFGTTKSEQIGLYYKDQQGSRKPVILGSYGIGITRVMGVIVEKFHDEKGIIWPESVAPFKVHLISLKGAENEAENIYQALLKEGIEVLLDDREVSAGAKFADSDLIGIPHRVIVSPKTIEQSSVEIKKRSDIESKLVKTRELVKYLQ
jgi:prolyl-tRNA synthetase